MNKSILFVSISMLLPTLIACTPDQINSAIEACKGDPSCYEIIDEAIEEELSSRGITGGKMTNIELEELEIFLSRYYFLDENKPNYLLAGIFSNKAGMFPDEINQNERSQISRYLEDTNYQKEIDLLNIKPIFETSKQLIIMEETKYVIYKTGLDSYKYEIYGDELNEFRIDLSIARVYFNNELLVKDIETTFFTFLNAEFYGNADVYGGNPLAITYNHKKAWKKEGSVHYFGSKSVRIENNQEADLYITTSFFNMETNTLLSVQLDYINDNDSFILIVTLHVSLLNSNKMLHWSDEAPLVDFSYQNHINFIQTYDSSKINYENVESVGDLTYEEVEELLLMLDNFPTQLFEYLV